MQYTHMMNLHASDQCTQSDEALCNDQYSKAAHLLLENEALTLPLPHHQLAQGRHTQRYPVAAWVHRHTCDGLETCRMVFWVHAASQSVQSNNLVLVHTNGKLVMRGHKTIKEVEANPMYREMVRVYEKGIFFLQLHIRRLYGYLRVSAFSTQWQLSMWATS